MEFRTLSGAEYARLLKRRKARGKNQNALADFLEGKAEHAVIECDSTGAARVKYQSLRNTIVLNSIPVVIQIRGNKILLSKN